MTREAWAKMQALQVRRACVRASWGRAPSTSALSGRTTSTRESVAMRLRRSRGVLPVAGGRCRPAARVHFSRRRDAGLPQFQRLQGICRGEPARWLEYVGHIRDLAGRADPIATAAHDNEIADLKRPSPISPAVNAAEATNRNTVTRAALFSGVLVKRVNMAVSVGPGATPFTEFPTW